MLTRKEKKKKVADAAGADAASALGATEQRGDIRSSRQILSLAQLDPERCAVYESCDFRFTARHSVPQLEPKI